VACSRNSADRRSPERAICFQTFPLYEITTYESGRVVQIFPSNVTAPPLSGELDAIAWKTSIDLELEQRSVRSAFWTSPLVHGSPSSGDA
jgi:hypothetical protein